MGIETLVEVQMHTEPALFDREEVAVPQSPFPPSRQPVDSMPRGYDRSAPVN